MLIVVESDLYPAKLRLIKRPPKALYAEGNVTGGLFDCCLAVVGSRRITLYGRQVVDFLLRDFVGTNVTVVSGFMYGIDACAHEAALKYGLRTVGVLPCGIDAERVSLMSGSTKLYKDILDASGAFVSEFSGEDGPQKWMFPARNRIVAGLCDAVLVVEADLNSGSLITADYAERFGRKIFVPPASIFSDNFRGIYQLIGKGATIVDSGARIREQLDVTSIGSIKSGNSAIDGCKDMTNCGKVLDILKSEPCTLDFLCRKTHLRISEVGNIVTELCINGLAHESSGVIYAS